MKRVWFTTVAIAALVAVGAPACTNDAHRSEQSAAARKDPLVGPMATISDRTPAMRTTTARFSVRSSINQLDVTGARPTSKIGLFDQANHNVAEMVTDDQGSALFRELPAGGGYLIQSFDGLPAESSARVEVMSEASSLPDQKFYDDQKVNEGFGYITTRDGTTLSASTYLPGPADAGPYPTVVEYSGYDPSNPTSTQVRDGVKAVGLDADSLCPGVIVACVDKDPAQPSSLIALSMGYAVVAVNVRGTGCSGGAFDFFEPLQLTDGYDVIETVAAQPWVKHHKVGMVGLSYPGIAELFVASTQPPHLAAISPMSVFDDSVRGVLSPGGIYNEGFAFEWVKRVNEKSKPYGQGWEQKVVLERNDTVCAANQKLRLQNVDKIALAKHYTYYPPELADPLDPSLFVNKINVPVFLTGSFQDEQTGGRFPNLFDKFTNAPVRRFTAFNGAHADGYAPQILAELKNFLDFYVAGEITPFPPGFSLFLPFVEQEAFATTAPLPPARFSPTEDFAAAKARYESEPSVRIIFEDGGDVGSPGAPAGRFEHSFASWPVAAQAVSFYLQPDGSLGEQAPDATDSSSSFLHDPELAAHQTLPGDKGGQAFHALPEYEWNQDKPGDATVFVSPPLAQDLVMVGNSNADLWIRSSAPDADVGVTLSEVRSDGKEAYVQSGFLRARMRKLATGSTELHPLHSNVEADAEPLSTQDWNEAQIEMLPVAHVFRAGSRLRISVHTPGGDRPTWTFVVEKFDTPPKISVAHDAEHPSRFIVPVSSEVTGYPADLPACPGLRGQPCRTYQPYINSPG